MWSLTHWGCKCNLYNHIVVPINIIKLNSTNNSVWDSAKEVGALSIVCAPMIGNRIGARGLL